MAEHSPLLSSSSNKHSNNNNNMSLNNNADDDDSLNKLLNSLEADPRYSDKAKNLKMTLKSKSNSNLYQHTPKEASDTTAVPTAASSSYQNTVDQDVANATNFSAEYLSQCSQWTPMNFLGAQYGVVVWNPHPLAVSEPQTACSFCNKPQESQDDPLFSPCPCRKSVHRSCFKEWRQGWINPRNYYSCPDCMYSYKIERIANDNYETPHEVMRQIRCKIGQLWAAIIISIIVFCSVVASISWAADRDEKNVPVFIKSILTSVVYGFPNANSTTDWREEFRDPDVHVFQYYGLLAAFICSLCILIASCFSSTDKTERSGENCCNQCHCQGSSTGSNDCFWCCYWTNVGDSTSPTSCNNCGDCCNCGGDGGCGDCDCSGGDCKLGDMGEAAAIIVVVLVVIVLVSAIFVAVGFAVRKSAQLHDSVATLIKKQSEELENSTIVFGMDEFVRPKTSV